MGVGQVLDSPKHGGYRSTWRPKGTGQIASPGCPTFGDPHSWAKGTLRPVLTPRQWARGQPHPECLEPQLKPGAPPQLLCPGGPLSSLMGLEAFLMARQTPTLFRASLTSNPSPHSPIQDTALYRDTMGYPSSKLKRYIYLLIQSFNKSSWSTSSVPGTIPGAGDL